MKSFYKCDKCNSSISATNIFNAEKAWKKMIANFIKTHRCED